MRGVLRTAKQFTNSKLSNVETRNFHRRELAALKRQGKAVGIGRPVMPTPPEATKICFEEFLAPILAHMPAGSKMRNSVSSKDVLILLHDNLEDLSAVFRRYVESDGDENSSTGSDEGDSIPNGAMTVSQFGLFARETGFADGNATGGGSQTVSGQGRRRMSIMGQHSSSKVSARDIRQIFSASQNDSEDEAVLRKVREEDDVSHHHQLMSFSEWLESICVRFYYCQFCRRTFLPHSSFVFSGSASSSLATRRRPRVTMKKTTSLAACTTTTASRRPSTWFAKVGRRRPTYEGRRLEGAAEAVIH